MAVNSSDRRPDFWWAAPGRQPGAARLSQFDKPQGLAYIRRTRRESVLAAENLQAAPPKGHTRKLSGKRTDRVEKPV
jgi:hypothetical protein